MNKKWVIVYVAIAAIVTSNYSQSNYKNIYDSEYYGVKENCQNYIILSFITKDDLLIEEKNIFNKSMNNCIYKFIWNDKVKKGYIDGLGMMYLREDNMLIIDNSTILSLNENIKSNINIDNSIWECFIDKQQLKITVENGNKVYCNGYNENGEKFEQLIGSIDYHADNYFGSIIINNLKYYFKINNKIMLLVPEDGSDSLLLIRSK